MFFILSHAVLYTELYIRSYTGLYIRTLVEKHYMNSIYSI